MNTKHLLTVVALVPLLAFAQVPPAFAKTLSTAGGRHGKVNHVVKRHKKGNSAVKKHVSVVAGVLQQLEGNTFSLNAGKKRGVYAVTVSDQTRYRGKSNAAATLSDFQNGDRVKVKGEIDVQNKTISKVTAVSELKTGKGKNATAANDGGSDSFWLF